MHASSEPQGDDAGTGFCHKASESNCSSQQTSGKTEPLEKGSELQHEQVSNGEREGDSESRALKRQSASQEPEDEDQNRGDMNDAEYRRLRRRITNRESAKRMRIKRQEELVTIQKELKKVTLENEQLRRYSAYLQKQQMVLANDVQHWQGKYTTASAEVTTLFQQLQQVVSMSAAFNPTILDVLANLQPTALSSHAQKPVLDALMQTLPQTCILAEAMETLRTSAETAAPPQLSALNSTFPQASASSLPTAASNAPTSSLLSAANLAAIRRAAAANVAEVRSAGPLPRGDSATAANADLLQPTPKRPKAASGVPSVEALTSAHAPSLTATKPADAAETAMRSDEQLKALSSYFTSFNLEAILKAAQQRVSASEAVDRRQ